jgi:hypothetical protein
VDKYKLEFGKTEQIISDDNILTNRNPHLCTEHNFVENFKARYRAEDNKLLENKCFNFAVDND